MEQNATKSKPEVTAETKSKAAVDGKVGSVTMYRKKSSQRTLPQVPTKTGETEFKAQNQGGI